MNNDRKNRIIENMKKHGLSQMIITSKESIYYVTGAWIDPGERLHALYIDDRGNTVFVLNELFSNNFCLGDMETITYRDEEDPLEIILKIINNKKVLGVEKNWPAQFLVGLMLKNNNIKFSNASTVIDEIRMVKDQNEISTMKKSSMIADMVMDELTSHITDNVTERQLSKIISRLFEKHGVAVTYLYLLEELYES